MRVHPRAALVTVGQGRFGDAGDGGDLFQLHRRPDGVESAMTAPLPVVQIIHGVAPSTAMFGHRPGPGASSSGQLGDARSS